MGEHIPTHLKVLRAMQRDANNASHLSRRPSRPGKNPPRAVDGFSDTVSTRARLMQPATAHPPRSRFSMPFDVPSYHFHPSIYIPVSTQFSCRPAVCERCGAEGDLMPGWHTDHALVCLEREVPTLPKCTPRMALLCHHQL